MVETQRVSPLWGSPPSRSIGRARVSSHAPSSSWLPRIPTWSSGSRNLDVTSKRTVVGPACCSVLVEGAEASSGGQRTPIGWKGSSNASVVSVSPPEATTTERWMCSPSHCGWCRMTYLYWISSPAGKCTVIENVSEFTRSIGTARATSQLPSQSWLPTIATPSVSESPGSFSSKLHSAATPFRATPFGGVSGLLDITPN
mmetsp:Transcript_34706/g.82657  ORF Transcript_34706/g.82657 Transcript_34706/m.82657 type:complete len:200 (-) Transcript_34706:918-1517(-)